MGIGRESSDGRRRWKRWTESEARAALEEQRASGESAHQFARRKGVSAQRLFYWKKRLATAGNPAFVAVRLPATAGTRQHIELVVEAVAIRLREDLDVEHVARLVFALARHGRGC